jgi:DNA topoisomerase-3
VTAPVDFTGKEPLGKCPKCGARVFDNGMNYTCEKAARKDLRFPHRQDHPAAPDRDGAGPETVDNGKDGFARQVHLQKRPALQGTILGQVIEPDQLQKLISAGRTDLLPGFMSKRGTLFPAFLVLDDKQKVVFEFPPREE